MTQIDQIIADALAGSPETHVAILAREVVRLRESPAVVVPEIMLSDISNECGAMLCDDREAFRRGALWAQKFITSRARAIPADRVLGEGMVQISKADRREFALLRQHFQLWEKENADDMKVADRAFNARQKVDELIRQHLRANQGGAEHGKV